MTDELEYQDPSGILFSREKGYAVGLYDTLQEACEEAARLNSHGIYDVRVRAWSIPKQEG
jgi:hypothetical protein